MADYNHTEKFSGSEGLTFDDVLLVPAYSKVLPNQVSTKTRFTRNIMVNVPWISAAMDTVTEAAMAIAMAQEGGIGVIHKNMSIEAQAAEVRKVKRAENGTISDPITLGMSATVGDALNVMHEHHIGGIPIIDEDNNLKGIVTNRDLRYEKNNHRPITEVMTEEDLVTITRDEIQDSEKMKGLLKQHKVEKLLIVEGDKLAGLVTHKDLAKSELRPNACKDDQGRLRVAAAVGNTPDVITRVTALYLADVDAIVLDSAHGHSKGIGDTLQQIKKKYPDLDVVAGNIATADAARMLIVQGADAVKVGIGPGSICTTRIIAGVGVPQLTAIMDVAKAAEDTGIPVIADGGIKFSGDAVKALAAGADCVMMGSALAGTEESPGRTVILEGRKFKTYRGMGSLEAMQRGSKDRYFQEGESDSTKLVPEGITGRVPYKGTLQEALHQFTGGLSSGMGYCGAADIARLKQAKFKKISPAGIRESHPHGVTITSEAPNYSP